MLDPDFKFKKPASVDFTKRNGDKITFSFDHKPDCMKVKETKDEDVEVNIRFSDFVGSDEEYQDENDFDFITFFDFLILFNLFNLFIINKILELLNLRKIVEHHIILRWINIYVQKNYKKS